MRHGMVLAVFAIGFLTGTVASTQKGEPPPAPERVTGIGGVFFKARDPKTLAAWYRDKLGVTFEAGGPYALFRWRDHKDTTREGTTVWSLFPATTKYFAPSEAPFMINYRVTNMDRLLAQLRAAGVQVDGKVAEDFNGKFAHVMDPEGNKIQLWEPKPGY